MDLKSSLYHSSPVSFVINMLGLFSTQRYLSIVYTVFNRCDEALKIFNYEVPRYYLDGYFIDNCRLYLLNMPITIELLQPHDGLSLARYSDYARAAIPE